MKLSVHGTIALIGISLVFGGYMLSRPNSALNAGLNVRGAIDADEEDLRVQEEFAAELTRVGKRIDQRIALKNIVVQNLIAGRVTLASAAEDFDSLNKLEPELVVQKSIFPGDTDKETAALQVVTYIRSAVKNRENEQKILDRVEGEFEKMFGRTPLNVIHR